MPTLKYDSGFTLAEILIALGITSLLAIGTGALMIEGLSAFKDQQVKSEALTLANHVRLQLQGAASSRIQAKARANSASTSDIIAARNCGDTVHILQNDHAVAVSEAQTTSGTRLRVNLISGIIENGSTVTYGSTSMRIDEVIFANADIIASDATHTLLSGEIYVSASRVAGATSFKKFRRHFVARAAIDVSAVVTGTADVNDIMSCNVQSALTLGSDCIGDSYYFDSVLNTCVRRVSDTLSTVKLCPPGFFGNSDANSDAACTPIVNTCGQYLADGVGPIGLDCTDQKATMASPLPALLPALPLPPALPPTPSPIPPSSEPPAVFAPAPLPTTATTDSCSCGAGSIPHGGFCSYCVYDVDVGYGQGYYYPTAPYIETIYQVSECVDGALRRLPSAALLTIPLLSSCNGSPRPAGRYGATYGFYLF